MKLSSDKNVEYFIGCNGFFDFVNDFLIEIDYLGINENEKIKVNLGDASQTIKKYTFSTQEDDISFYTFKEVFIENIYISDKVKVEPNDFVVDIGSNYGFFSYQAKEIGARKVISYEPSKKLQKHLHRNLDKFGVEIFQKAISGISGISKFEEDEISSASSHLSKNNLGYNVEMIGINDLIDSLNENIDFMKIDCETSEYELLLNKDLSNVKYIAIELHNQLGIEKYIELHNFLSKTHNCNEKCNFIEMQNQEFLFYNKKII
jgi:FkbM family methyltransferase